MASKDEDMVEVTLRNPEGHVAVCKMPADLASMLKKDNCDTEVKQQVLEAVFNSNVEEEICNMDSNDLFGSGDEPPNSISTPSNMKQLSNTAMTPNSTKVHNWTEKEEIFLITVRGEMEEKFIGTKAHETLWNDIHKKMEEEGMKLSVTQIMNKWKNLKKRYKEVVDLNSKTGNETVNWKHYSKFNELYGNKASTKLQASYDSTNTKADRANMHTTKTNLSVKDAHLGKLSADVAQSSSSGKTQQAKKRKKGGMIEMIEQLKENAEESLIEIKEHNEKQLKRLDRFLDLYEQSVTGKNVRRKIIQIILKISLIIL